MTHLFVEFRRAADTTAAVSSETVGGPGSRGSGGLVVGCLLFVVFFLNF